MEFKTQEEYNQIYGNLCAELGDRTVKIKALEEQIAILMTKIKEVAEESTKAAQERAKETTEEQVNPQG